LAWDIIPALDTALKHRLTGAVILVLLAVLLLPELLTGSGRAKDPRGPSAGPPDSAERSFDIDLTQGTADPRLAQPPLAAESTATQPAAPLNLPVPPAAVATPTPAAPLPAATSPAAETPPAAAPPPAASSVDAYYVQLGVFVNRASATNLANKLKTGNFAVKVDEIRRDNKILHRVRVGPVADRVAANALLKRLADAGHAGSVVK
jgi:DedD protein